MLYFFCIKFGIVVNGSLDVIWIFVSGKILNLLIFCYIYLIKKIKIIVFIRKFVSIIQIDINVKEKFLLSMVVFIYFSIQQRKVGGF